MLNNNWLDYAKSLGFGELHFKIDPNSQLVASIAIHSTYRGPALGGCRFIEYNSIDAAIYDSLRLARGMTYKAAVANLPLGGGKTVLMRPKQLTNRVDYFRTLGCFIDELKGRYIAAMDSGVVLEDMDSIALETPYVVTTSKHSGNPAPYTALGVLRGIEAAVKFKWNLETLRGLRIIIQGAGQVATHLLSYLHQRGAQLIVCDRDPHRAARCAQDFKATVVPPEAIYQVEGDIFAPCALGGILNESTLAQLNVAVIAGAANNQLAEPQHAQTLDEKGILYVPDYVINVGGLIYAYAEYCQTIDIKAITAQVNTIYDTVLELLQRATREKKRPEEIADNMAEERLHR